MRNPTTRRGLFAAGATLAVAGAGLAIAHRPATESTIEPAAHYAPLTPCTTKKITPEQMEGPFYRPSSPQRIDLVESGISGALLTLTGQVMTKDCRPVPGALLDFWQADRHGDYDNGGYRLRGHQFADVDGCYRLQTIVPRSYDGTGGFRTPHIHLHVQRPGGKLLVTQLYFPGAIKAYGMDIDGTNKVDFLFDPELLVQLKAVEGNSFRACFDFVIE
ncbi:dioxygenase [Pseudonocardiaceae bacterium YIM PH 21723]|nr:dioxygenase [Pseudonocardiaceae bacterium YIM PH 21723]